MGSHKMFKTKVLAVALAILLAGCSALTIINYISAALDIVTQFVPVPGLSPAVVNAFGAAAGCVAFAATEMASADTDAAKGAKITAECSAIVATKLPAGTPQTILDLFSRVVTKIADILAHVPSPPASPTARAASTKLSPSDLARLNGIAARAKSEQSRITGTK